MKNIDSSSSDSSKITQHQIDTWAGFIEKKELWLIFSLGLSKNADVAAWTDRLFSAGGILGEPRTNFPKGGWELNVDCLRFRIPDGDLANCTKQYRDRQFTAVLLETKEHPFKPTMPLRGKRRQPQDLLKDNITPLRLNVSTIIDLLERLLKACLPPTPFSQSFSIPPSPPCMEICLRALDDNLRLEDKLTSLKASIADLRRVLDEGLLKAHAPPGPPSRSVTLPSSRPCLEIHPQEPDDNSFSGDDDEQDFVSCKDDTEEVSCPLPGGHAQEHASSALTGPPNDALFASPPGADNSADATDGHELQEPRPLKRKRGGGSASTLSKKCRPTSVQPTINPSAPPQGQGENPFSGERPKKQPYLKGARKKLFEEAVRQVFQDNPGVAFTQNDLLAKINKRPEVIADGVFPKSVRDTLRRRIQENGDGIDAEKMSL